MSFIHKIIDRATRHNNTTEEKPQRRSFFGFGGSTNTSASPIDQQTEDTVKDPLPEAELKKTSSDSSLIAGESQLK
jgi:hypothetical protein